MEITKTHGILNVKEAAQIAVEAAQQIFEGQQLLDLALEEVELTDDERYWMITLGFSVETKAPVGTNIFGTPVSSDYSRKYKLFKIDAQNGAVQSMKIRELA